MTRYFQKQGIEGPSYSLLYGSFTEIKKLKKAAKEMVLDVHSNDIAKKAFPHYDKWSAEYGETLLYWHGTKPAVTIVDPELAKQILSNKFGFYVKPKFKPEILTLLGNGLVTLAGVEWARHKRVLNPAFSMDKLKVMTNRMATCAMEMIDEWKNLVAVSEDRCTKVEMGAAFRKLTADIIAHTAFGSCFMEGREAFKAQQELQNCCAASSADIDIPGARYLPTPSNLQLWKLEWKLKNSMKRIIQKRIELQALTNSGSYGDDLLGLMMDASETDHHTKDGPELNMDEIVDECKTFFFAGHETTSNVLTWTIFLLSLHQEWQERLRNEVLKECGTEVPDAEMIAKLKEVNMVVLETLRLYGPAIQLLREASNDMKLGNLMIPQGTILAIPMMKIHRKKEYWGEDVNDFNPLRFKNGVSMAAKHPNALLAFSAGPRACIGQNFALMEAKTVLVMFLQNFTFSLSPEYRHAPVENLTLQPQHGLPIIVKPRKF